MNSHCNTIGKISYNKKDISVTTTLVTPITFLVLFKKIRCFLAIQQIFP